MRQVGMWLTIVGFAVLVLGLALQLRSYVETGQEEASRLDRAEIKIQGENAADLPELRERFEKGQDEQGVPLSAEERLEVARRIIDVQGQRLTTFQQMQQTTAAADSYREKVQERLFRAGLVFVVGLVFAIVGVIITITTSVGRRKAEAASEQATPAGAESAQAEPPAEAQPRTEWSDTEATTDAEQQPEESGPEGPDESEES